MRDSRQISWVKAARRQFLKFPKGAQDDMKDALTLAAEGRKAEITKPMTGLGAGVLEIALKYRTDAYRVVYALKLDQDIWVVHAFQKKAKQGSKTPQQEIDLVRERIKRLKKELMR